MKSSRILSFNKLMADWYFIQGIHRSGTSILGSWLQETGVFRVLTLGDVIRIFEDPQNYPEFEIARKGGEPELRELKAKLGHWTRGYDNIRVTADTFEEYPRLTTAEPPFGKLCQVLASRRPWSHFYPRNLYCLGSDNIEKFQVLSKILGQKDDRPQLYKNPYDLTNPYVYQLKARHIFIFRDPVDTLNSLVKQVQGFYKKINPYLAAVSRFYRESYKNKLYRSFALLGSVMPVGVQMICRRIISELNTQIELMENLDGRHYYCVDYEDLCLDNHETHNDDESSYPQRDKAINNILDFFGLDTNTVMHIRSSVAIRNNSLLPSVKKLQPKLKRELYRYYKKRDEIRKISRK